MCYLKMIFLIFLINLLSTIALSNQRFICSRSDTNEVVNFYISENKLFLSGLSISGTYSILTKQLSGILAVNISKIGDAGGIEVIFLNLNKKTFTVRSSIINSKKNSLIEIKGNCK